MKTWELVADLSARLSVMHEMSYLPEDAEYIDPIGTMALREAKLYLNTNKAPVPDELEHWLAKLRRTTPN